jgi:hypothetical protein
MFDGESATPWLEIADGAMPVQDKRWRLPAAPTSPDRLDGRYARLNVDEEGAWRGFADRQEMRFRRTLKECGKYRGRDLGARAQSPTKTNANTLEITLS